MCRIAVALVAAAFVVGCGADDDPEERRAALEALVAELALVPLPNEESVRVTRVQSKSDEPYYVATGVLDDATRQGGSARVAEALVAEGWDVFESGPSSFLGSCVRARLGSMVTTVEVGWTDGPPNDTYPRLSNSVYVQAAVGSEGSNQVWTDVETPRC